VKHGSDEIQEKDKRTGKEGKYDNEEVCKRDKVSLEEVPRMGRRSDRGNKRKGERKRVSENQKVTSMQQSPCETNSVSAAQEIYCL
jgi:hypothetical protein